MPEEAGVSSPIRKFPLGLKLRLFVVYPSFEVSVFIHLITFVYIEYTTTSGNLDAMLVLVIPGSLV